MMPLITRYQLVCQILFFVSFIWTNVTTVGVAQSQSSNRDQICNITPSDQFQAGFQIRTLEPEKATIISARTPSQTEMTIPSLWWAVEQFDPLEGQLVTHWEANRTTQVINLIVNNRLWRTLDYIERYSFVNRFGTVARDYNYHLSVISQEQDCLAIYTCNFQVTPPNCQINFDSRY